MKAEAEEIEYIAESIRRGDCLLFIGPDLAVPPGQRKPVHELIADKLRASSRRSVAGSLSHVAQAVTIPLGGPHRVRYEIVRELGHYGQQTTTVHRKLADLPFPHVLTTSFDSFLLNAWAERGIKVHREWFNFRHSLPDKVVGFRQDSGPAGRQSPFLYQLFGSTDAQESMVITENDLIDYLLKVGRDQLPSDVVNLISNPEKPRLFLGFGLHHWHFRALLRILDCHPTHGGSAFRTQSHSFERKAFPGEDSVVAPDVIAQARVFYESPGHQIVLHDTPAEDFVMALHASFMERPTPVPLASAAFDFGPVKPYVFLSYSRDESPAMERVKDYLVRHGIEVWFDKDGIPGGADWSEEIRTQIELVDYMVFVHPVHPKVKAYWRKELLDGFEHSKKFAPRRFLIPVLMEAGSRSELTGELASLQAVDFGENPERLVTTIHQDWALRHKVPGGVHPRFGAPSEGRVAMNHQKEIGDRYRYPGTRSFSDLEHDQGLFFGRELEAEELFEGIRRFPLTVLSGKSGLGKTSLLQASIYPRLRREGCAILTIRLEVDDGRPIVDLLTANFEGDCRAQKVDLHEGSRNSLWDYFQTCGIFRGVELLRPVLVLDQFEELFTVLGRPRQREVLMQLGPLINRKPPRQFETELLDHAKRWGTTKPAMAAGLGHDIEEQPTDPDDSACSNWEGGWGTVEASAEVQPPDISLVIGIRHEFIGLLKSFGEHLQGIDSNMMILRPLTYEQARQAIEKPAAFQGQPGQFAIPPFTYSEAEVERILEQLTFSDQQRAAELKDLKRDGTWKEYAEVEPFQLQVVCQEIEERMWEIHRRHPGLPLFVPATALGGMSGFENILDRHYEDAMEQLPIEDRSRVQRLFDRGLIEESKESQLMVVRRKSLPLAMIEKDFKVTEETLKKLRELRLIRRDFLNRIPFYELTHDTLIGPVRRKFKADPRELPPEVKMRLRVLGFAVVVCGIASAVLGAQWREANQAADIAKAERLKTVEKLSGANVELKAVQELKEEALREASAAQAASKKAQNDLDLANQKKDAALKQADQAAAEAREAAAEADRLKENAALDSAIAAIKNRRETTSPPPSGTSPESPEQSEQAFLSAVKDAEAAKTNDGAVEKWGEAYSLGMSQLISAKAELGTGGAFPAADPPRLLLIRKWTARTVGAFVAIARLRREFGPLAPDARGYKLQPLLAVLPGDSPWIELARRRVKLEIAMNEAVLSSSQFSDLWQLVQARSPVASVECGKLVARRKALIEVLNSVAWPQAAPGTDEGLTLDVAKWEMQFAAELSPGMMQGQAWRLSCLLEPSPQSPAEELLKQAEKGEQLVLQLRQSLQNLAVQDHGLEGRQDSHWTARLTSQAAFLRLDLLFRIAQLVEGDSQRRAVAVSRFKEALAETKMMYRGAPLSYEAAALLFREVLLATDEAPDGSMESVRILLGLQGNPSVGATGPASLRMQDYAKASSADILVRLDLNRYAWLAKEVDEPRFDDSLPVASVDVCKAQARAIEQFAFLGREGRMPVADFELRLGYLMPKAQVATNEIPVTFSFNNSLGMKFVRIPYRKPNPEILTPNALISVWETRVADFRKFVEEERARVNWRDTAGSNRNEPVVNVSVEDARKFCRWLTTQEQKKGVIPATATYRLPRDGYEWGYVAIFLLRKDGDPEPSVFPWGSDPLPWEPNVGNFGGGEVVVKSIPVPPIESDIRPKYRDDFPGLSPVGSFPPNALGIYDLEGNVSEWTTGDKSKGEKVLLRGGSWLQSDAFKLRLDVPQRGYFTEYEIVPEERQGGESWIGFRVVLEMD